MTVRLLNRASDEVLRALADAGENGDISIATSLADSLSSPGKQHLIDNDVDEGIWEEMESGLVHHGRLTINYVLLMIPGGMIATAALAAEPIHAAAATIAASIIAPGYEPFAKIPLALVLRRWPILRHALISVLVGYASLVLAAAITATVLVWTGDVTGQAISGSSFVKEIIDPDTGMVLVSAAGALAGATMITSFRESVLAGPLIALALISTAAVTGAGVAIGDIPPIIGGLKRLVLDASFVVLLGFVLFGPKQMTTHRRDPIT